MTKPPSLELHERLVNQRVALLAGPTNATLSLDLFAKSKPAGALQGAGQGIASFLGAGNPGGCSGEYCGAALLLYLAVAVVVGGTIGAIRGSMAAPSAEASERLENSVREKMGDFAAHVDLPSRIAEQSRKVPGLAVDLVKIDAGPAVLTASALSELKQKGYDKAVAIQIDRFDFVGDKGDDPSLGLYIEVSTRIIDTGSQEEEYHRTFDVLGEVRHYSEWLRLDAKRLSAELDAYLEKVAEDVVNGLFMSYELPIDSGSWSFPGSETYGCCWICPTDPALEISYFPEVTQRWPSVDTRPRLAWRPFPDDRQQAQFRQKTGSRASNVRYDLKIWELPRRQLGKPVYERYALAEPVHQVEDSLASGHRYLWSVRACFELGPRVACTPWAFCMLPAGKDACESTTISPQNYYHFQVR